MKRTFIRALTGLLMFAALPAVAQSEIELCQSDTENSVIRAANCDLALRLGELSSEQMIVALYNRGQASLLAEQPAKALEDFEAVLKLQPGDKDAILGRAISRRQLKQFDGALADIDLLLAQNYQPAAKLYLQRGITHFMDGNAGQSLADLRKAKELAPDDAVIADRLWKTEQFIKQKGK